MSRPALLEGLDPGNAPLTLRAHDGSVLPMNLERWLATPSAVDEVLLDRAVGPVLDVGCGPGRHVAALTARGVLALGVDSSTNAVQIAVNRGIPVLRRSIFDPLPGTGRWRTLLILEGSIGIGGDPSALLARGVELLHRRGRMLVEVAPPGAQTRTLDARLESAGRTTPWFPWALVALDALPHLCELAGLRIAESWKGDGRWFAGLYRE
jgi:SAM-dependent methyltransferase